MEQVKRIKSSLGTVITNTDRQTDKVETEVRHTLLDPLLYICTFEMIFDPSSPTELEQEPPLTPSFISYH